MPSPFIIIDEIADKITSAKTEILNKIELVNTSVNNTYTSVTNVNTLNLVNNLLSDSNNANKWALRQTGIGAALNSAFDMNNSTLAGLNTAANIAANQSALLAILKNEEAYNVCKLNTTINNAFKSIDNETVLANGLGYKLFSVGDTVSIKYGGTATTFRVVHKNYKTTNKIVLVSENILTEQYWHNSNANDYSTSIIRKYLNGTVLGNFSSAIQNAIVTTSVACHNDLTAVTCKDKIWLPSFAEVGLGTDNYAPVEGTAWSYFTSESTRIKKYSGTATSWWLRTPNTYNSDRAWCLSQDGSRGNKYGTLVTSLKGVVPAFEI